MFKKFNSLPILQKQLIFTGVTAGITAGGSFAFLGILSAGCHTILATSFWSRHQKPRLRLVSGGFAFMLSSMGFALGLFSNPSLDILSPPRVEASSSPVVKPLVPVEPEPVNPLIIQGLERKAWQLEIQNDPKRFNLPRNGGTTTLAQKCEAYEKGLLSGFEFGFKAAYEHHIGDMHPEAACYRLSEVGL